MVAVRGSIRIEAPLAEAGAILCPDSYILHMAALANDKMKENMIRIDRLAAQCGPSLLAVPASAEEATVSPWALLAPRSGAEQLRILLDRAGLYDDGRRITPFGPDKAQIAIPITETAAWALEGVLEQDAVAAIAVEGDLLEQLLGMGDLAVTKEALCGPQKAVRRRDTPYQKLCLACEKLCGKEWVEEARLPLFNPYFTPI